MKTRLGKPEIREEDLAKLTLLDLGFADVHVPSAVHAEEKPRMKYSFNAKFECAEDCDKEMSRLNAAKECGDVDEAEFSDYKSKIEEASKKLSVHVPTAAVITPEMSLKGEVVTLSDESYTDRKQVWIQVAKQGKFRGHAAGPFEMNTGTFEEIIRNFRASSNQQIPVDFEHASEQDPTEGTIPSQGAPAQGWIVDLRISNDGNLWGLVEWLPLARQYIKNRQYKFLSPAVVFGAKDRVTGKPIGARLSSVALTNNPFLDGMQPVAAKHKERSSSAMIPAVEAIRTALSLPEYFGGEANTERMLIALTALPKTEARASTLRDALRLPLTMSAEDVFETARVACGGTVNNQEGTGASMGDRPEEVNTMDLAKQVSDLSTQLAETKVTLTATTKQVSEAEQKVTLSEQKAQAAEAKIAEVTMSLKEETAKREAAETELSALKLKWEEESKKQFNLRLDEAFETYKDARKLTSEDKEMMSTFLMSSPEKFEARFPKIAADKRHLMRNLTENTEKKEGAAPLNTVPSDGSDNAIVINMADAARELSRQRGIPLDAAQRIIVSRSAKQKNKG